MLVYWLADFSDVMLMKQLKNATNVREDCITRAIGGCGPFEKYTNVSSSGAGMKFVAEYISFFRMLEMIFGGNC